MSILKKTYENIINLTAGFRFIAKKPLDDRIVVDTYESLQAYIENNDQIYNGMVVSVINDPDLSNNGLYTYLKLPEYNKESSEFKWVKLETDIQNSDNILELDGGNSSDDYIKRYNKDNAGG